jgi:Zn-dependent protease
MGPSKTDRGVPLGRVVGIPVRLHWSLLVVFGLLTLDLAAALSRTMTPATVIVAALAAAGLFASVLAHELGHAIVARHFRVRVDGITLWLLGGVSRLDGEVPSAGALAQIAVAGPAVSVGLAAGLAGLALGSGALAIPAVVVTALGWLALTNIVLAVFNLIPAAPLDGGRMFAAAVWAHTRDREKGDLVAARSGRVVGWAMVGFGAAAFFDGTSTALWFAVLGWFVLTAADAERRVATFRSDARGMRVRDVMTSTPEPRPGWITVSVFLERFAAGGASAFVIERWEGGTAGVVTLDRLLAGAPEARACTRVVELAVPVERLRIVGPNDDLAVAWSRPGGESDAAPHLAVLDRGRIVGVVTPEDVDRALSVATRVRL